MEGVSPPSAHRCLATGRKPLGTGHRAKSTANHLLCVPGHPFRGPGLSLLISKVAQIVSVWFPSQDCGEANRRECVKILRESPQIAKRFPSAFPTQGVCWLLQRSSPPTSHGHRPVSLGGWLNGVLGAVGPLSGVGRVLAGCALRGCLLRGWPPSSTSSWPRAHRAPCIQQCSDVTR